MGDVYGSFLAILIMAIYVFVIEMCRPLVSGMISRAPLIRFLIMPGIVFHELCHLIACILLLRKVTNVNLYYYYKKEGAGGYVNYISENKLTEAFTDMIVGLAPLIGSSALFIIVSHYISIPSIESFGYNPLAWVMASVTIATNEIHLGLLILLVSVSWSAMPSLQDLKIAMKGILMSGVVAVVFISTIDQLDYLAVLKGIEFLMEGMIWIVVPSLAVLFFVYAVVNFFSSKTYL